ncbi:MAG: hypothetical protein A2Z99_00870 [Treponema sp. GWB1_62_6]|nr:MAG: hypothetical protein A2Z99_00870 [Treponema sp. GWB1_62_6]
MTTDAAATYRATFPAGFRPLAERLLVRDFRTVRDGDESSMLFDADPPLKLPPYLQGASLLLASIEERRLDDAYRRFADLAEGRRGGGRERAGTGDCVRNLETAVGAFAGVSGAARFALRGFIAGEPSSVPTELRGRLERAVTRATGLRPDSAQSDLEFQVALRDDGHAYFLVAPRAKNEEERKKGTLPRSTSRLLCELSRPEAGDVFLDPFAGSGAIPLERVRTGPFAMIFAGDRDEVLVDELKAKLKKPPYERKRKAIFPKVLDARELGRFEDGFFTAIVTDPPWGAFDGSSPVELEDLYAAFLREFGRLLAPEGRLVLLVSRDGPLDRVLAKSTAAWNVTEDYSVLVSGRKARAVVLMKGSN